MTLEEYYAEKIASIKNCLQFEDPPGHWSYFVYCTYSASFAEHYANLVPQTPPNINFSELSTTTISAFDKFVANRFEAHINAYLKYQLPRPVREETQNSMHLDYIRMSPGTSIPATREHFKAEVYPNDNEEAQVMMRYRQFVVIDDESLQSLLDGPEPITELNIPQGFDYDAQRREYESQTSGENGMFVKVVDVHYDEACGGIITASRVRGPVAKDSPDCITFHGWLKVSPRSLLMLIDDLDTFGALQDVFQRPDTIFDTI